MLNFRPFEARHSLHQIMSIVWLTRTSPWKLAPPHRYVLFSHVNLASPRQDRIRFASTSPSSSPGPSNANDHKITLGNRNLLHRINASFERLGITGRIKLVVVTILCIFGTMETVFYTQMILRWWRGEQKERSEG